MPPQKLSYRSKNKKWRMECIDWADKNYFIHNSYTRKSIKNKIINYNLVNGILDMDDVQLVLNPNQIKSSFNPDKIQHYPIINSKLNIIKGEEWGRRFDARVVVTNPEAISEMNEQKKELMMQELEQWITQGIDPEQEGAEEEQQKQLAKIEDYYKYKWKDLREIRANYLLKHYYQELDMALKFNSGIMDAMICGEEIYQCDIVGGEPTMERINPKKIQVIRSGFSNRVEDADMILLWDYWSPGRIQDTFYDVLKESDIKYITELPFGSTSLDNQANYDEEKSYNLLDPWGGEYGEGVVVEGRLGLFGPPMYSYSNITDNLGNIRVLRLYWKSYRRIKKVKSYDPMTGEEDFNFYPEDYIPNKDVGEEVEILYIMEAWEATKIGKVYVNMRPRVVQYNRLENPSRCHFGIVGSIYNLNDSKPYSMVDMMKWYNYLYDVTMDNMLKVMATNWGKIVKMDLATVPSGWEVDKWLYYAKINRIAITDSFKEGNKGAAMGKLAGLMNNQSSGVIDATQGDEIQHYVNVLEWITETMSSMVGITKQREGAIDNRETVGGVERSVLQSSHITEWLFMTHDNVKKRVLECFIETAKAALRGQKKKFQYLLSDGTNKIIDIDGDEFCECDYGLVIQDSRQSQELIQSLDGLAQAMVQNQLMTGSDLIKIKTTNSIAEITRTMQESEARTMQQQQEAAQAEREMQQAQLEQQAALEEGKLRLLEENNIRDNETKLMIAGIQSETNLMNNEANEVPKEVPYNPEKQAELSEKIREWNDKHSLEKAKFEFDKKKTAEELRLKNKQINKSPIKK